MGSQPGSADFDHPSRVDVVDKQPISPKSPLNTSVGPTDLLAPIIPRSSSVNTHRSQTSTWEVPDVRAEVGDRDYSSILIAKVLRSKYPPHLDEEPFHLPIKRAFHALDWTSRGWLTRAQVEKSCIDGAGLTGWTLSSEEVARIVMLEDSKEEKPDHHIDPDEFFNIVIAIRAAIKTTTVADSIKVGLSEAAAALIGWYWSTKPTKPCSDQWHVESRLRVTGTGSYDAVVYRHDVARRIARLQHPLSSRPDQRNLSSYTIFHFET